MIISRRNVLASAVTGFALSAAPAFALPEKTVKGVSSALLGKALDALNRHYGNIVQRDVIAIADFALASRAPRFHLLDLGSGKVSSYLVAHGHGSDPAHTGWLQRFSNAPASHATSAGAYRTDAFYSGEHGPSIRLSGLDESNSNALARAIVVHSAWYVSDDIASTSGILGRSDGCFVFSDTSIREILARLGPGRMIYADRIA
jgi:hypothetical protein